MKIHLPFIKAQFRFKGMKEINSLELTPSAFFTISNSAHASFIYEYDFVWEILPNLESYIQTCSLGSIAIDIPTHCTLVNPELISIAEGTVIDPYALIEGPCVIGKNCHIRHGAYVRKGSLIGDHCVVGHSSEIKQSILLDGACAPHFNYVGNSLIGRDVNLGAGAICANFRFDSKEVVIHSPGKRIPTGLKKMGAIIGDEVQIGCHCVLNPGTVIGPKALCYPMLHISGYVESGSVVRGQE